MKLKKFLAVTAAAVLTMSAIATSALAAGSKSGAIRAKEDAGHSDHYVVFEPNTRAKWKDNAAKAENTAAHAAIDKVNAGGSMADFIAATGVSGLDNKKFVTTFYDLDRTGEDVTKNAAGQYLPTLIVDALTSGLKGVLFVHYSWDRNVWEVVTPDKVDLAAKEITVALDDCSPFAIVADASSAAEPTKAPSGNGGGVSPKTGASSNWMVWGFAAVALAGAALVTSRKRAK